MTEKQHPNWADWFYYDPTSPSGLRWKVAVWSGSHKRRLQIGADECAGSLHSGGRGWEVRLCRRGYKVHRIVYELTSGNVLLPRHMIDHIDGNPANNAASNLRIATPKQNARNLSKRPHNTSGHTGVSYNTKRAYWSAHWRSDCGKSMAKTFSVKTYGYDGAKQLAIYARAAAIEELNAAGAGYTERHGK